MFAVSNTSPLIVLLKIGYLSSTRILFKKIYIPKGVEEESSKKEDETCKRIRELLEEGFVEVRTVENKDAVKILNAELGLGESEVIVLSREIKADYVLLDDQKARLWARSFDINVIGTLGIIRALLKRGVIKENPDAIYKKLRSVDFWISKELFSRILK